MKYMLLMYANENSAPESPEEQQALGQEWYGLMQEAQESGILLSNNGFAPVANSTTVRVRDGKTVTTDGPFAETHEQLGGFFLVDCENLDDAIAWAAKIPHARYGSVEIRPLWSEI
ncbi:MAG: YciI family protein [Anaerolineae bacterium]|nr:YciI family protein [Anaerolineae bacterium]